MKGESMRLLNLFAGALMMAGAWSGQAFAADYPERPIKVVVPFAAGGGADVNGRVVIDEMKSVLGATMLVENRPGAGATIGAEQVARAAPDGYTLLFTTGTSHSAAPALFKKLSFDPIKDFTPVALVNTGPLMLLVNSSSPVRDLKELLAWMKANPAHAFYGYSSSTSRVAGNEIAKRSGIPLTAVPYNGASQVMTDLAGGAVGFTFVDIAAARPFLEGKRLKAIAVTSLQRTASFPEIPTVAESGFAGFETIAWAGFFAPAGTPSAIVNKLSASVRVALEKTRVRVHMIAAGEPAYLPPAEMARFVQAQLVFWTQKIREAGIEPQ